MVLDLLRLAVAFGGVALSADDASGATAHGVGAQLVGGAAYVQQRAARDRHGLR
jgi:hypothetical protein